MSSENENGAADASVANDIGGFEASVSAEVSAGSLDTTGGGAGLDSGSGGGNEISATAGLGAPATTRPL
jgi:hypothetical protein